MAEWNVREWMRSVPVRTAPQPPLRQEDFRLGEVCWVVGGGVAHPQQVGARGDAIASDDCVFLQVSTAITTADHCTSSSQPNQEAVETHSDG